MTLHRKTAADDARLAGDADSSANRLLPAPSKIVRQLEIVNFIPKSASGKILRRILIERERALASGEASFEIH